MEASGAAVPSSGSFKIGSSADLFFFALLLGFACPLRKIKRSVQIQQIEMNTGSAGYHYLGSVLKADKLDCIDSPEEGEVS